jgi:hypothetical protein
LAIEEKIPCRFKLGLDEDKQAPGFSVELASEKKSEALVAVASSSAHGVMVGLVSDPQSDVLDDAPYETAYTVIPRLVAY